MNFNLTLPFAVLGVFLILALLAHFYVQYRSTPGWSLMTGFNQSVHELLTWIGTIGGALALCIQQVVDAVTYLAGVPGLAPKADAWLNANFPSPVAGAVAILFLGGLALAHRKAVTAASSN